MITIEDRRGLWQATFRRQKRLMDAERKRRRNISMGKLRNTRINRVPMAVDALSLSGPALANLEGTKAALLNAYMTEEDLRKLEEEKINRRARKEKMSALTSRFSSVPLRSLKVGWAAKHRSPDSNTEELFSLDWIHNHYSKSKVSKCARAVLEYKRNQSTPMPPRPIQSIASERNSPSPALYTSADEALRMGLGAVLPRMSYMALPEAASDANPRLSTMAGMQLLLASLQKQGDTSDDEDSVDGSPYKPARNMVSSQVVHLNPLSSKQGSSRPSSGGSMTNADADSLNPNSTPEPIPPMLISPRVRKLAEYTAETWSNLTPRPPLPSPILVPLTHRSAFGHFTASPRKPLVYPGLAPRQPTYDIFPLPNANNPDQQIKIHSRSLRETRGSIFSKPVDLNCESPTPPPLQSHQGSRRSSIMLTGETPSHLAGMRRASRRASLASNLAGLNRRSSIAALLAMPSQTQEDSEKQRLKRVLKQLEGGEAWGRTRDWHRLTHSGDVTPISSPGSSNRSTVGSRHDLSPRMHFHLHFGCVGHIPQAYSLS